MDSSPPIEKTNITLSNIPSDAWFFLLDQTEKNTPLEQIQKGMLERGIDNDNTTQLLKELPDFIKEKMEDISTQFSVGIFFSIAGLALNLLPISYDKNRPFIIVAYSLMGIGILKIIRMGLQKIKFIKILKNLNNHIDDL